MSEKLKKHNAQTRSVTTITPELAIKIFGEYAREPVAHNLSRYCNNWLIIDQDISSLEQLPIYQNEQARAYIEITLRNLRKAKYQVEREIKRLQQCAERLEGKRLFSEPIKQSGLIDVAKLKEQIDIVDIVSASVELRRSGNTYKGRCPFHDDRSPSLVVYPENNSYWCFSCSEGGDVISFVQKINNCDFREAIGILQPL